MKSVLKKLCYWSLVTTMVFCLASYGEAANVKWKLSHHRPVNSQLDKDMIQFANDVDKATSGRVKIEVFPAAQLGGSELVMERVGMGAVEMMVGFPSSTMDPKLDIYSLPGIAKDFSDLRKLFRAGSPYMKILEKTFNDLDIHVLASYCTAFSGMCFKGEPSNILDPAAKHKEKIRVPSINSYRYAAESLGYLTTPLPWGEVFTALQTGVVDGVSGPAAEPTYTSLRDVIKCYVPVNSQADTFFLLVNTDSFKKISKEDQAAIMKLASALEDSRFKVAGKEQTMWENRLKESGVKVYSLTDAQLAAFQKTIQDYSWPKLRKDMGEAFFDGVIAAWKTALK